MVCRGFKVKGLGLEVQGLGLKVKGLGFQGLKVKGVGLKLRVPINSIVSQFQFLRG